MNLQWWILVKWKKGAAARPLTIHKPTIILKFQYNQRLSLNNQRLSLSLKKHNYPKVLKKSTTIIKFKKSQNYPKVLQYLRFIFKFESYHLSDPAV